MSARMTMQRRRGDRAGDGDWAAGTRLPSGALRTALSQPAGGTAMDEAARAYLEPRFGHDFSQVRVHADAEADQLAQAVDAVAFTSGQDIYFRQGAYTPDRPEGLRLLAHEAAHTVQQAAGPVAGEPGPDGVRVSDPADPFERAAEETADHVTAGPSAASAPPAPAESGPSVSVQRFMGFPGLGDDGGAPFDLGGGISALGSLVGGGVSGVGSLMGKAASAEGSLADNVLSGAGSTAGSIMSGIGSMVGSEVSGVGSLLGGGASAIGSALGLGGLGSSIGSAISGGAKTLGGDISGVAGALGGDVADLTGMAGGAVGGLAGAIGGDISGAASGIGGLISGAASDAGQFVSGLGLPSIRPEDLQM